MNQFPIRAVSLSFLLEHIGFPRLTECLIISIFYFPFIAHKVLAIALTQSLFAEPARQRKQRDKSSRGSFCLLAKQLKCDGSCLNGAVTHHSIREKIEPNTISNFNLYLSFLTVHALRHSVATNEVPLFFLERSVFNIPWR